MNAKCTCGREMSESELDGYCHGCGGRDHRWSEDLQAMEPYPYHSIPWDKEEDCSAQIDKMPDRMMHW